MQLQLFLFLHPIPFPVGTTHRIFYLSSMQRLKEHLPVSSTRAKSSLDHRKPFTPYDQLPVALRSQHMPPFSQIFHNTQYSLARKEKVRDITSHTLEKEFHNTHHLQRQKEKELLKSFKVRCRRNEGQPKTSSNQDFFIELLKDRQNEQMRLTSEYLAMIRELKQGTEQGEGCFDGRQKRIFEYNIMYDYRAEHLSNPFKPHQR